MTLDITANVALTGTYTRPRGLGSVDYTLNFGQLKELLTGVGAYQADLVYETGRYPDPAFPGRTLAASATENLNFSSLVDAIGDPLAFVKVKLLYVYAYPTNVNNVVLGGGTNPWLGFFGGATHTIEVPPDGILLHTAPQNGWPVVAGTGDILKVANGGAGTPVTYDVILVGTSA